MLEVNLVKSLIFLPLVASLLCQFSSKKIVSLAIFTTSISLLFIGFFFLFFNYQEAKNLNQSSIGLEFKISKLSSFFITFIIFLKAAAMFFYQDEIFPKLNSKRLRTFLSINLVNIFAIIGILTSNNLLNIFFFIEIFTISMFAALSMGKDKKSFNLLANYFVLQTISSLILLFCILMIFLTFGSFDVEIIKEKFIQSQNLNLSKPLFFLIFLSFIVKFFPIWLYFQNFKNNNYFLSANLIFISANLGLFLIHKLDFLFFKNLSSSFIFLSLALIVNFFSAFNIAFNKHLKIVAINFCLNAISFASISILINNEASFRAFVFFIISLNSVGFFLIIFADFLRKIFDTSFYDRISFLAIFYKKFIFPLKFLLIFIAAAPFTSLFYGNLNLISSIFAKSHFSLSIIDNFVQILIILSTSLSYFAMINCAFKLSSSLFCKKAQEDSKIVKILQDGFLRCLITFWIFVILCYFLLFNQVFLFKNL